jgi:hypothetical protein
VTYSRLSKSDSNIAKCVVCLQIMTSWDSTKIPIYKLVQRPDCIYISASKNGIVPCCCAWYVPRLDG